MSQETSALALSAAGVAVSMVYQIRNDRDPIPVFVIGGIYTGLVVTVAAIDPEVGTALAAVFFLGMFLTRGSALIDWADGAVKGSKSDTTHPAAKAKKVKKTHG